MVKTPVMIIAELYVLAFSIPEIKEFPSVSIIGKYAFSSGIKLKRYKARMLHPTPASTMMFDFATVEKNTAETVTHNPNNHQHTTENIRFCATELSQKYALQQYVITKHSQ